MERELTVPRRILSSGVDDHHLSVAIDPMCTFTVMLVLVNQSAVG
jgi:hypothetical protein